eukprot:NODE_2576_length_1085_cov_10.681467_g2145_i0.p1 GENE.NODE_2576_length_1085_cov_10.681467_g2145_i0~~NODE_2576_length_1085_cov_10.681467_g2145_i0.p1  ORF type:complete len:275 (+),score=44.60 NODE_2576_length_1085_cov_10.681467_g2145_i0:168-992(+)
MYRAPPSRSPARCAAVPCGRNRSTRGRAGRSPRKKQNPEDLLIGGVYRVMDEAAAQELQYLNDRYARGEVSDEEYQHRWAELSKIPADQSRPRLDPQAYSHKDKNMQWASQVDKSAEELAYLNEQYGKGAISQAVYEKRWTQLTGLSINQHDFDPEKHEAPPPVVVNKVERVAEPTVHTHDLHVRVIKDAPVWNLPPPDLSQASQSPPPAAASAPAVAPTTTPSLSFPPAGAFGAASSHSHFGGASFGTAHFGSGFGQPPSVHGTHGFGAPPCF